MDESGNAPTCLWLELCRVYYNSRLSGVFFYCQYKDALKICLGHGIRVDCLPLFECGIV